MSFSLMDLPTSAFSMLCSFLDTKTKRVLSKISKELRDLVLKVDKEREPAVLLYEMIVIHGQEAMSSDEEDEDEEGGGDYGYGFMWGGRGERRADPRREAYSHKIAHVLILRTPSNQKKILSRGDKDGYEASELIREQLEEVLPQYYIEEFQIVVAKRVEENNQHAITEAEYESVNGHIFEVMEALQENYLLTSKIKLVVSIPDVVYTYKAYFTEAEDGFSMYDMVECVHKAGIRDFTLSGWVDWNEEERENMIPFLKKYYRDGPEPYLAHTFNFKKFCVEVRLQNDRRDMDDEDMKGIAVNLEQQISQMMNGDLACVYLRMVLVIEDEFMPTMQKELGKIGDKWTAANTNSWRHHNSVFYNENYRLSWDTVKPDTMAIVVEKKKTKNDGQ